MEIEMEIEKKMGRKGVNWDGLALGRLLVR